MTDTPTTAAGRALLDIRRDGCIEWDGAITGEGYGSRWIGKGKTALAHRVAYEEQVGPIPKGMTLDHLCRNRRCVNTLHLEPVTNRENILRGTSPSAVHARKTHCPWATNTRPRTRRSGPTVLGAVRRAVRQPTTP